ncbi:MAG: gliding motility-associated C-terminal domain-containing protein [Flavobacteriia bacterium]|nr:gliding motility-associated C-terminal domain-containing protein [Flavobacteriia bacterium]
MKATLIYSLLFILINNFVYSQNSNNKFGFIENGGQIRNQFYQVNKDVKYLFPNGKGMNVQLKSTGFSYDFYQTTQVRSKIKKKGIKQVEIPSVSLKTQRIDISFVDANQDVQLFAESKLSTELFFAGNIHVSQYEKVIYKELYPSIDAVFTINSKTNQVKYDFIVRPGGDISKIKLKFNGFDQSVFAAKNIELHHSLGILNEVIPQSWWLETNEKVDVSYSKIMQTKNELIVGFQIPLNNLSKTLVIDPEPFLHWGVYIGDTLNTTGTGVTTDNNGNIYICGITQSLHSIATQGAYQAQLNDSLFTDAYLMKYNEIGTCIWSTYFGGNNIDIAMDVAVDTMNHVYLFGTTFSDSLLAYNAINQQNISGSQDAFLAKFTSNGHFIWSTYYGGLGEETGNKITMDFIGNVFITGTTQNSLNELATSGVHQVSNNGAIDVFVSKIDTSGAIIWGTYFGGTLNDQATGISFGDSSLLISGYTNSIDFISTDSTHQDSLKGLVDGYIARFNPTDGQQVWGTYFGGSNDDYVNSIKVYNDVVYFVGTTLSDDFIDIDTVNQTFKNGEEDAFIGRIYNDSGKVLWSSYIGGAMADYGIELDIEMDNQAFVIGTTLSDTAIATTNVHQDSLGGLQDVFVVKYNSLGDKVWGSYYGGAMNEEANSLDVYGNTSVYFTGSTQSVNGIINPNFMNGQDTLFGTTDGFLGRFTQDMSTLPSGFGNGSGSGTGGSGSGTGGSGSGGPFGFYYCVGDTITISLNGGSLGTDAVWAWYKDGCGNGSTHMGFGYSISFVATTSFQLYVRAESVTNSTTCISQAIQVGTVTPVNILSSSTTCAQTNYEFNSDADTLNFVTWSGPNAYTSTDFNPIITSIDTAQAGEYVVELTNEYGCKDRDTLNLIVHENPGMQVASTPISCYNIADGQIDLSSTIGNLIYTFNGVTDTISSFENLGANTYIFSVTDTNGCSTMDSLILLNPNKIILDTLIISDVCTLNSGEATVFIDSSYSNYSVIWSNLDTTLTISNLPSGNYSVNVTLANNCVDSSEIIIPMQTNLQIQFTTIQNESCINLQDGFAIVEGQQGTAPYTYSWSQGNATNTISNLSPGNYNVIVADANNCIKSDSLTILPGNTVVWEDSILFSDCAQNNGFIDIQSIVGQGPFTFNWSNNTHSEDLLHVGAGTYSLQILDGTGCVFTETYEMQNLNNLQVTATNDTTINIGNSIQLVSSSNSLDSLVSILWSPTETLSCFTCPSSIATPLISTEYIVLYTHNSGCYGSETITISITNPCPELFIPTAFSPNDDGNNDEWCIYGGCIDNISIVVFNQWGQSIFSSTSDCWDGTYQGVLVPNDTYVYHIDIQLENGESISQSGSVHVNY